MTGNVAAIIPIPSALSCRKPKMFFQVSENVRPASVDQDIASVRDAVAEQCKLGVAGLLIAVKVKRSHCGKLSALVNCRHEQLAAADMAPPGKKPIGVLEWASLRR